MLIAEDLAVGHGRRTVASGIGFVLEPGQVLCLLGPNGGGKTTLLRTLLGLIPPIEGRVRVAGEDLSRLSRREAARLLAYVPQAAPGGFGHLALDLVMMGRAARLPFLATPGPKDRAMAEAALARLGIAHLAARPVTELSGGERQLVLIARAVAQQAACLLLDEPTGSLDFGNQTLVLKEVRALAKREGLAVLMTTHHPDHAFLVADAAMMLQPDGIIGPMPPEALITADRLRAAYHVEALVQPIATSSGPRWVCAPLAPR